VKLLVQRVRKAAVDVGGERIASIQRGLLILVGVAPTDGTEQICWLVDKTLGLRIFPGDGKDMNRSVVDIGGEVLVVSQFTLMADTGRGKRPGFSNAASPEVAAARYEELIALMRRQVAVQTGRFGADMQVSLVNDGPVTLMLER